jgi:hypothetical protein
VRTLARDREDRHGRALVVIAADRGIREVQDLGNLLGDGREHVGRRRSLRNQRRHPPQRRLLLGKPPRLTALLRAGRIELARRIHRVTVPHVVSGDVSNSPIGRKTHFDARSIPR